jgi:subtilisin family serine protease
MSKFKVNHLLSDTCLMKVPRTRRRWAQGRMTASWAMVVVLIASPIFSEGDKAHAAAPKRQPFPTRAPAPSGKHWLVGVRPGERSEARRAVEEAGAEVERFLAAARILEIRAGNAAVAKIRSDKSVVFVEPDQEASIVAVPNDPLYEDLWAMPFIHAPEAWDLTTGSATVVVAVLDTGVEYDHPDLADNIWTNSGEIPGNSIDDDENGWVDDVHGADCISNDGDPYDGNGHGTHVAGSVGAVGNNGIGIVGVSWDVQIMPLRFMDMWGNGSISDAVECLDYAIEMGADIVNNSWTVGPIPSVALEEAFNRSLAAGQLQVAAAGNDSVDIDTFDRYPASLMHPNIVSVTSWGANEGLASYSNYGDESVDMAGPGNVVWSTVPTDVDPSGYTWATGTSMAAPHVAGAAALLLSLDPDLTGLQLGRYLLSGVGRFSELDGKVATGGRLSITGAIAQMGEPTVTAVSEAPREGASLDGGDTPYRLSWDGLDADGVDEYEVEVTVNGGTFAPIPLGSPSPVYKNVSLRNTNTYGYRVRALDPFANASDWALTPTFRPLIREERWGAIAYAGNWTIVSSSAAHGGRLRLATRNARATIALPAGARTVGIVAMVGRKEGRAQIWLDGVHVATLDLYRSTFHAQRLVYSAELDAGIHVLQVRAPGRKNPLSGSTRVGLDAIVMTVATS